MEVIELEVLDQQLQIAAHSINVAQSEMAPCQPVKHKDLQIRVVKEPQGLIQYSSSGSLTCRQLIIDVQHKASALRHRELLTDQIQSLEQRMHMQRDLLHLWQIVEAQLSPDQAQFAQRLPRIDYAQRLD